MHGDFLHGILGMSWHAPAVAVLASWATPTGGALGQADSLLAALHTRHEGLQALRRRFIAGTFMLLNVTTASCACACKG